MFNLQPTQLLIIGMALLGFMLIMRATRRNWRKSHQRRESPVRDRYQELQRNVSAARDVEQVMLELDQLARQIHGKLDTRFAKLEQIIRDADERIDRLARLVRQSKGQSTLDVTIGDSPEPDAAEPSRRGAESARSALPAGQSLAEELTSAGPCLPADASRLASPLTPRGEQRREAVYKLADEGLEPIDIAQRVGRTTGEIELILSLRKAAAQGATVSP